MNDWQINLIVTMLVTFILTIGVVLITVHITVHSYLMMIEKQECLTVEDLKK